LLYLNSLCSSVWSKKGFFLKLPRPPLAGYSRRAAPARIPRLRGG